MNREATHDPQIAYIDDLRIEGTRKLPKHIAEYFNEGSMDLLTVADNIKSFEKYRLRPRVCRDVTTMDTSTECFGVKVKFPLGISPSAMHRLAHPDGEIATSRAAATNGVNMILSTYATTSVYDVVKAGKGYGNAYAQQLTVTMHWESNMESLRRAEAAGCKAFVVTVDCAFHGRRLNEYRNALSLPEHLDFPNLPTGVDPHNILTGDPKISNDTALSWEKIREFVRSTKIQIWLKGITTAEDAELAVQAGVAGIIVSTHGGRQLDGVASSLDALPGVVEAVAGRIPVHIDSGIRRGSDIFKALALGASHCWVGRIALWGLAYDGEAGVDLALKLLYDEFRTVMGLCGCKQLSDIKRSHLGLIASDGSCRPLPDIGAEGHTYQRMMARL